MSLLIVIALVWMVLVAFAIALLRIAAIADDDAERQSRQAQWRAAEAGREPAPATRRFVADPRSRAREHTTATGL